MTVNTRKSNIWDFLRAAIYGCSAAFCVYVAAMGYVGAAGQASTAVMYSSDAMLRHNATMYKMQREQEEQILRAIPKARGRKA
jgi:sugar (pentulose or hexulose) kinase